MTEQRRGAVPLLSQPLTQAPSATAPPRAPPRTHTYTAPREASTHGSVTVPTGNHYQSLHSVLQHPQFGFQYLQCFALRGFGLFRCGTAVLYSAVPSLAKVGEETERACVQTAAILNLSSCNI